MIGRLRRIGSGIATLAGLRVELFAIELREQFELWVRVAALSVATIVLGCIGLGFVAVAVSVAFWDSHPLAALGVFALLFLGAAAACARALSAAIARAPAAFGATLGEFRKDGEATGSTRGASGAAGTARGEGRGPGTFPDGGVADDATRREGGAP